MALGRPTKPYRTSWNEDVPGLRRKRDGRWEIRKLNIRFTEANERRAVEKAKHLLGLDNVGTTAVEVTVGDLLGPDAPDVIEALTSEQADRLAPIFDGYDYEATEGNNLADVPLKLRVPDTILYPWIANQLATNLDEFAAKVGRPDLLKLKHLPAPRPPLSLAKIIANYETHGPATSKAKQEALAPLRKLIKRSNAKTLDDLTTPVLLAFKTHIEATIPGPATRRAYYSRIRAIIRFGLKTGLLPLPVHDFRVPIHAD